MGKVIDLGARRKQLEEAKSRFDTSFLDVGDVKDLDPAKWLCMLYEKGGDPVFNRVGVNFDITAGRGSPQLPTIGLSVEQAREFGTALLQAADLVDACDFDRDEPGAG